MLYSPTQFARDQLLADLLAVRERLTTAWNKGGWQQGDNVCIVAAVRLTTGYSSAVGMVHVPQGTTDTAQVRLGRALVAIYLALYGPKANRAVTLSEVQAAIIGFNDGKANHGAVLLLIDRAVAAVHAQAGASVTASA